MIYLIISNFIKMTNSSINHLRDNTLLRDPLMKSRYKEGSRYSFWISCNLNYLSFRFMSSISMQISDLFIKYPIIYFSVLICNPKYFEISLGRYSTYFLKKTYNSWLDGNFCWLITSLFFNISKLSLNVIFRLCLISKFWWIKIIPFCSPWSIRVLKMFEILSNLCSMNF